MCLYLPSRGLFLYGSQIRAKTKARSGSVVEIKKMANMAVVVVSQLPPTLQPDLQLSVACERHLTLTLRDAKKKWLISGKEGKEKSFFF